MPVLRSPAADPNRLTGNNDFALVVLLRSPRPRVPSLFLRLVMVELSTLRRCRRRFGFSAPRLLGMSGSCLLGALAGDVNLCVQYTSDLFS